MAGPRFWSIFRMPSSVAVKYGLFKGLGRLNSPYFTATSEGLVGQRCLLVRSCYAAVTESAWNFSPAASTAAASCSAVTVSAHSTWTVWVS